MVMMLLNTISLACLAQAAFKALIDKGLQILSTTNTAPLDPYLASSLSSPYFKYANIWTYVLQFFLNVLQGGYLITTIHGDIYIQAAQGVLI